MSKPCLHPVTISRPNDKPGFGTFMQVPCGKCTSCDLNRVEEYTNRAIAELKYSDNAFFVTLTYNDENLPYDETYGEPTLSKYDYQTFLKRLRKLISIDELNVSLHPFPAFKWQKMRYILCGEYGPQNDRPHYHAILYNMPWLIKGQKHEHYVANLINRAWKLGFTKTGLVSPGGMNYVVSYILGKRTWNKPWQSPFLEASRRPGIGCNYANENKNWHTSEKDRLNMHLGSGNFVKMPRYVSNKIFSEREREHIGEAKYLMAAEKRQKNIEFHKSEELYLKAVIEENDRILEHKKQQKSKLKTIKK